MYKVVLRDIIHSDSTDSLSIYKEIEMPFPPYPGLQIGMLDDSDFNFDSEEIERVFWSVPNMVFFAELRRHGRYPESATSVFRSIVDDGWKVNLMNSGMPSPDDVRTGYDAPYLVRVGDKYHRLDPIELEALEIEGADFSVLEEIGSN